MKKLLVAFICLLAISTCAFVVSCDFSFNPGTSSSPDSTERTPVAVVYAQAQELGFEGTLEEFLALVQGEDGKDGVGIVSATVNENGELIITLTEGEPLNLGKVTAEDGKDGAPGEKGEQGEQGEQGEPGQDGAPGQDGVGIAKAEIVNGELVLTYTDGRVVNLGTVVGADGEDGAPGQNGQDGAPGEKGEQGEQGEQGEPGQDGAPGQDGVGIAKAEIVNGELVLTYTDGRVVNLGTVVGADGEDGAPGQNGQDGAPGEKGEQGEQGEKGEPGQDGAPGQDGVGIAKAEIVNGELVLTYTDGRVVNLGTVVGADGEDGAPGKDGQDGAPGQDGKDGEDGENLTACEHAYGDWVETLSATCTSIGYNTRVCGLCGDVDYAFIAEKGHLFELVHLLEDTCKARKELHACSECATTKYVTAEPVKSHIFEGNVCTVCGEEMDDSFLAAYNGTYGYNYFGTMENGTALQSFYMEIDAAAKAFHLGSEDADGLVVAALNYVDNGLTEGEAVAVWKIYEHDNPLYYWISNSVTVEGENLLLLTDDDYALASARAEYNQLVYDAVDSYLQSVSEETSSYRIALDFHDAIVQAIDYSYDASGNPEESLWAHNVVGVFTGTGAVCEGYAKTFQLLLNKAGVENIYVTGVANGEDHAWNLIRLDDGGWYWCDLTWDDAPGYEIGFKENYFAVNDTQNVNWSNEDPTYPYEPTVIKFVDNHTYNTPASVDQTFLYGLPARSEAAYSTEAHPVIGEFITVDDATFKVIAYNALQFCGTTATGSYAIPEKVAYKNNVYETLSISLGNGVYRIASVTELTIPKTVRFIWDGALRPYRAEKLEDIYVDEQNPYFTAKDGVLYTKSLYTLIAYPFANTRTEFTVPEQTCEIAYLSFGHGETEELLYLEKITIGKNVEIIGITNWGSGYHDGPVEGDFGGNIASGGLSRICAQLTGSKTIAIEEGNQVYTQIDGAIYSANLRYLYAVSGEVEELIIPKELVYIDGPSVGVIVLEEHTKLKSIAVEEGNESFSAYEGILYNSDYSEIVFVPRSITEVKLHTDLKTIGACSFEGCNKMVSIVIPEGVTTIGISAFEGCSSLTSIVIPDSVTLIEGEAFSKCSSLTNVVIGEGVTMIGFRVFDECSSLSSIIIPDSVTSIGISAFEECTNLISIEIPDSVTSIGDSVFWNCSSLTSIVIPNSVTSIGEYVFQGCEGLTNVIIGDGVTMIGFRVFWNCSSLTSIEIPDSVTSIGDSAFENCSSLTSIEIPDSVTSIGSYAFGWCSNLTSIVIPDSVTSIGDYAFYGCYGITSVYYHGTPEEFTEIAIGDHNNYLTDATIYYYSESAPADTEYSYWHYDEDGNPIAW